MQARVHGQIKIDRAKCKPEAQMHPTCKPTRAGGPVLLQVRSPTRPRILLHVPHCRSFLCGVAGCLRGSTPGGTRPTEIEAHPPCHFRGFRKGHWDGGGRREVAFIPPRPPSAGFRQGQAQLTRRCFRVKSKGGHPHGPCSRRISRALAPLIGRLVDRGVPSTLECPKASSPICLCFAALAIY